MAESAAVVSVIYIVEIPLLVIYELLVFEYHTVHVLDCRLVISLLVTTPMRYVLHFLQLLDWNLGSICRTQSQ